MRPKRSCGQCLHARSPESEQVTETLNALCCLASSTMGVYAASCPTPAERKLSGEGLEPSRLPTRPSNVRVYQFRHPDKIKATLTFSPFDRIRKASLAMAIV